MMGVAVQHVGHSSQVVNVYQFASSMSNALSAATKETFRNIQSLKGSATSSVSNADAPDPQKSIVPVLNDQRAEVYNAIAQAKLRVSMVAMHLDDAWRQRLFAQLDRIHDIEEWEPEDKPVQAQSFETFIRTMIVLRPRKWPNLGLSHDGHLLAVWGTAQDRVTLEFLGGDCVRWTLSHVRPDNNIVRNAGLGPSLQILSLLSPYNPDHWFNEER